MIQGKPEMAGKIIQLVQVSFFRLCFEGCSRWSRLLRLFFFLC